MTGTHRTWDDEAPRSDRPADANSRGEVDGSATPDRDPLHAALRATGRFVWDNLVTVVLLSLAWAVAALPLVTVGPASVGVYAAVLSLREEGRIDRDRVLQTVREQFVHATLLSLAPLAVATVAVNYGLAYLATGETAAGLLALVGTYAALYLTLVSVPTFAALADGAPVFDAVRDGYLWTAGHPVAAVAMGALTASLLAVTALLTIAAPLLFAGVAAAFHVALLAETDPDETALPNP